jgi:hypothetical protein
MLNFQFKFNKYIQKILIRSVLIFIYTIININYFFAVENKSAIANTLKSSSSNSKQKKSPLIYLPPAEDAPQKGRIYTSERPDCPESDKPLTAIVPKWNLALTISESPNFWFYIPYASNMIDSVAIVLWDEEQNKIAQTTVIVENTPGIINIKLPQTILNIDQRYRVDFSITCKAINSKGKGGNITVITWLKRVDLDDNLASKLKVANTPREKYILYAANGIWYEVLTELAELRKSQNEDPQVIQDWQDFLSQIEYLREVVNVYPERNFATVRFVNEPDSPSREVSISELIRVFAPINKRLQQFYQLLIDPIAELLPTNPEAKIIFIPHQELFLLPFPALQGEQGKYLIEQHTISTSPAIQILESTHQRREQIRGKAKEVIVVGNPSPMPGNFAPIEGTEKEAKAVAKKLRVRPFIGAEATEKNIRQKLSQAKLIHFATHGTFNNQDPLQGVIALAPSADGYDGMLTAEKVLNLNYLLNAELVVLSACDTGRGKISGDGVIGLSRSWMVAGVSSMIVSLWQVPDVEATPLLMEKFYEKYTKEKSNKAQALRQAMLITKSKYPKPKDWAAFTLIGETE